MPVHKKIVIIGAIVFIAVFSVFVGVKLSEGYRYMGTCSVQEKYIESGTCYIQIETAAGEILQLSCSEDVYEKIICAPDVLYDLSYRYYTIFPQRSHILHFNTDSYIDNRTKEGG